VRGKAPAHFDFDCEEKERSLSPTGGEGRGEGEATDAITCFLFLLCAAGLSGHRSFALCLFESIWKRPSAYGNILMRVRFLECVKHHGREGLAYKFRTK
jgi:hypothetical protein